VFQKYLHQVVQPQEEMLLKQWLGYMLIPGQPYKKAFILVGLKHAGKTTFMKVLQTFVGKGYYSTLTLHQISKDPFLLPNLVGKVANISPDMSAESLSDMGVFKALTGGDEVTVRGVYSNSTQLENSAKMIFSCNEVPQAIGADDAYYDRFRIIPFPHSFTLSDTAIPDYDKVLTTPEELSGILNMAIGFRNKLIIKNGFTDVEDYIKTRNLYRTWTGNTILQFIGMRLHLAYDAQCSKDRVLEEYEKYCNVLQKPAVNKGLFWQVLKTELRDNILEYKGKDEDKELEHDVEMGGQRVRYVKGIEFNNM